MKFQFIISIFAILFINSQISAQENLKAAPFLAALDVFTGTFEGTTVIPTGTTDSERLGEVQGKKVTIVETTRWAPGKCAQVVDVSYRIDGSETILGTTLFGWDQIKKQITTTQFTTHKGVWNGTVERDGDKWVFSYVGEIPRRQERYGEVGQTFEDADHYTMTETELTLDGKPQPDVTWHFKRLS